MEQWGMFGEDTPGLPACLGAGIPAAYREGSKDVGGKMQPAGMTNVVLEAYRPVVGHPLGRDDDGRGSWIVGRCGRTRYVGLRRHMGRSKILRHNLAGLDVVDVVTQSDAHQRYRDDQEDAREPEDHPERYILGVAWLDAEQVKGVAGGHECRNACTGVSGPFHEAPSEGLNWQRSINNYSIKQQITQQPYRILTS